MAGTTPIYGFPYPESSDLVANYPALGEQLAEGIETELNSPTFGGNPKVLKPGTSDAGLETVTSLGGWKFGTGIGAAADVFNIYHTSAPVGEYLRIATNGNISGTGQSLGAWTSYSPVLIGATIGNGTIVGNYQVMGRVMHVRITITFGSTTNFGGGAILGVNLPAATNHQTNSTARYTDTSAGTAYWGHIVNTGGSLVALAGIGANGLVQGVTNVFPFTLAPADVITLETVLEY